MQRWFIEPWAAGLPRDQQALAIAAFGVLVGARWAETGEIEQTGVRSEALAELLSSIWQVSPDRLSWGGYDLSTWRTVRRLLVPREAALGWQVMRGRMTAGVNLEVVSDQFEDQSAVETYKWLAELWSAGETGVHSVYFGWWWKTYADRISQGRHSWHWPLRLGFLPDTSSQNLLREFLRSDLGWIRTLTRPIEVARSGQSCDLLLSPLTVRETCDVLQHLKVNATAILLMGRGRFSTPDNAVAMQELRSTANAASIACVYRKVRLELLVEIIREISRNQPFDAAICVAARRVSAKTVVIAEKEFIRHSRIGHLGERWATRLDGRQALKLAGEMRTVATTDFLSESGAASRLAQLASEPILQRQQPRILKTKTWLIDENRAMFRPARALVAERWHAIVINIAPRTREERGELPVFPDEKIDSDEDQQQLKIVVAAPECDVLSVPSWLGPIYEGYARDEWRSWLYRVGRKERKEPATTALADIKIRSTGSSTDAIFVLNPISAKDFKARILVLHGNRILQTAILQGAVIDAEQAEYEGERTIEIVPEGTLRSTFQDLGERRVFDLALLTNDTLTGAAQLTAVADQSVWLCDLAELKVVAARIGACLKDLVDSPTAFKGTGSEALTSLLINLAHEGVRIRRHLRDAGLGPILDRDPARVQIVAAKPDEVLPVELIYDGSAPDPKIAAICPNQAIALAAASCKDCPHRNESAHVCALRFWGLRKVIERQMYHAGADRDQVTAGLPSLDLERISRPRIRLFASSRRAEKFKGGFEAIEKLKKQLAGSTRASPPLPQGTVSQVYAVERWADWRQYVQQHAPALLVLLPHTDISDVGEVLEIGDDDVLTSAQIDESVVGAKQPVIVLLLGCETANPQVRYVNFVASFRHAKAAIVIGTLTPILGRHAAPIAGALIEQLDRYWDEPFKVVTVGDAMAETRRKFMAQGLPVGLALVAFGDADWLLGS